MAQLEVDNLHASYQNARGREVLRGVSFLMDGGQSLLIHGHNGSGKSTLLKALAGLIPTTSGMINWGGKSECNRRFGQPIRSWVGFHMQSNSVFNGLSVRANVALAAAGRDVAQRDAEQEVSKRFPLLRPLWRKRAGLLSGGQRKVLAMALATISDPPLLLLDEPLAGLSGDSAAAVLSCVHARKSAGAIVIVVEHSMDRLGEGLIDLHAEMIEGTLEMTSVPMCEEGSVP